MPNLTKEFVLRGPKRKRRGPARSRLIVETIVSLLIIGTIPTFSLCSHVPIFIIIRVWNRHPSPRTQEALKLIPHTTKDWLKTVVSNLSIIAGKSSRRRATTTWRRTSSSSSGSWRTWIKWRRRGTRKPRENFCFEQPSLGRREEKCLYYHSLSTFPGLRQTTQNGKNWKPKLKRYRGMKLKE